MINRYSSRYVVLLVPRYNEEHKQLNVRPPRLSSFDSDNSHPPRQAKYTMCLPFTSSSRPLVAQNERTKKKEKKRNRKRMRKGKEKSWIYRCVV